jgi:hypothetical protein
MSLRGLFLGLSMIVACIVGTLHAQAPDPARHAAAKEMLVHSGGTRQFDEVITLVFDQLAGGYAGAAPGKEKEIRAVFQELAPKFKPRQAQVMDQLAALFAKELTKQDLDAIVAFYKSPVGLKLVNAQSKTMREAMQIGQNWGMQLGMDIDAEARKELKKRGIDVR